MKKLTTLILLSVAILFTSFTPNKKSAANTVRYAFVTDTEYDKALDEPENNGYVNIITNIVTISCDAGRAAIESQYIEHYAAEEQTENRDRAFIGSAGITNAWIFDSYDKALAARRDWMAKTTSRHKRMIKRFYVTCN